MDHEQGQQPSLAVAISDSLQDVINGRIPSFLQSLEALSDMSKAVSSRTAPSEVESTRSFYDMELSNDEVLALTLEAEEVATVKSTSEETSTSASQAGAKANTHTHKHSCTVDGTCTRDLWLRGMMTLACASIILLS